MTNKDFVNYIDGDRTFLREATGAATHFVLLFEEGANPVPLFEQHLLVCCNKADENAVATNSNRGLGQFGLQAKCLRKRRISMIASVQSKHEVRVATLLVAAVGARLHSGAGASSA